MDGPSASRPSGGFQVIILNKLQGSTKKRC